MYRKIMVPVDGSELAECVFPHVETIARATQALVELVRVIEPLEIPTKGGLALTVEQIKQIELKITEEVQSYLTETAGVMRNKGLKVESKALHGRVAESLVDYARTTGADIIIMATHGRSGVSRWVRGSIADRVLHGSYVPILLVHAPGSVPAT